MRHIGDIWGVSESTLRTFVEARYRRVGDIVQPARGSTEPGIDAASDSVVQSSAEIGAPPEAVWPWICQLNRGGGAYGPAALETGRVRSADYLLPVVAPPRPGDRIDQLLVVASVSPGERIVWKSVAPIVLLGLEIPSLTIEYRIAPAAPGRTRLTIELRGRLPATTGTVSDYLLWILGLLLPSAQSERIKACVEGYAERGALGLTNRGRVRLHQAPAFIPAPEQRAKAG
jgi:hypothetical protein